MKLKLKTEKQQAMDAELGLIVDEFGRAMWSADKQAIANGLVLTMNMSTALGKFQDYCVRYYGQKTKKS